MGWARRWAWTVFLLVSALVFLFGVFPGTWFGDDEPVDRELQWLVTTYAGVAVVLTVAIALTGLRRGERWAWLALWVWPVFFVVHGVVFFPFDFVLAALTALALVVSVPRDIAVETTMP